MELWRKVGISAGSLLLAGYTVYSIFKAKNKERIGKSIKDINTITEFAANAKAFSGLFEPLYKIAKGIGKYRIGVIGDWDARTENLQNAQSYVEYWKTNFGNFSDWTPEQGIQKADELLSFILSAGICRGDEPDIVVDGNTYKLYECSDEMIEEGSAASVVNPYWVYDETVLEKGIIKEKEGDVDNG